MRSLSAVALILGVSGVAQAQRADRLEALMMVDRGGGGPAEKPAGPLEQERLTVAIDGQEASTTLLQTWRNDTGARMEGNYSLRAGSGTHVDGFAYWNGEQKIVGEVFERDTARQVYQRVTTRRRDPGLLEEAGEGAFAFKIFPIEANEHKRVEVRWSKWLERHGQTVHYRAPIGRRDADVVIQIVGPMKNVRSTTHRLHEEKIAGGVRLRADGGSDAGVIDVSWDIDEPIWTPDVYVHADGQNDGYFTLALATPPTVSQTTAKDVTIVIDRSGSMTGDPIEHADAAAAKMIELLGNDDRVNVIAFSDEVDPLFQKPQPVGEVRGQAIRFARGLMAGGGTDIALALSTAIKAQDKKEGRPRIVVFMTDGQSDLQKALAAAETDTGDVRLFTLGLGKEVNRPLLQRLAAIKRGKFSYIADASAIEPEVRRVAEHIARPVLVDLAIEIDGAQATRLYPRSLPDLFADDELVVSGRLRGTAPTKFTIRGKLGGKPYSWSRTIDLAKASPRRWVGGVWAKARVEHLLEELSLKADQPELKQEAIELALAYNFVTPFTAFLAVPESELGDMAGTVAAARERKAKILAAHRDAAALGSTTVDPNAPPPASIDVSGTNAPTSSTRVAAMPPRPRETINAGPSPSPKPDRVARDEDRSEGGADDDAEDAKPTSSYAGTVQSKGHGCAGCASGGSGGGTLLLGLAVAAALSRRRRR